MILMMKHVMIIPLTSQIALLIILLEQLQIVNFVTILHGWTLINVVLLVNTGVHLGA